jgi:hypothetical protein
VERELRFTFGAQRRIVKEFGCDLYNAFASLGDVALPGVLYCLMHDENGKPPEGLTAARFQETADPEETLSMMEALYAAMEQGKAPKNVLAALGVAIEQMKGEKKPKAPVQTMSGSPPGVSPISVSDSPAPNSRT